MAGVARDTDAWGRVIVRPEAAFEYLYQGGEIDELLVRDSPIVIQYNDVCRARARDNKIVNTPVVRDDDPALEHQRRANAWFVPDEYRSIDVRSFVLGLCQSEVERDRVNLEMNLFEERQLVPLLQTMIFLVGHFRQNNLVWGVGRGSSVASYCLYLIGVHKINSIKYGLEIDQFLK